MDWGATFAVVGTCGVAGAFIDFLMGKAGQKRVRGWLEDWWLRLSYVTWGNFGREEAAFAISVLDRLFGTRLLSLRRFIAVLVALSILYFAEWMFVGFRVGRFATLPDAFSIFLTILLMALSFFLTRLSALFVMHRMTESIYHNIAIVITSLLLQYEAIFIFTHTIDSTSYLLENYAVVLYDGAGFPPLSISNILDDIELFSADFSLSRAIQPSYQMDILSSMFGGYQEGEGFVVRFYALSSAFPGMVRILVLAVFVIFVLLRPLQAPITLLWARVVESDAPVFTLLFGGG